MPATPVDASPASNAIFCKTKMCKFYMEGRCTRNTACKFAHGAAELEPLPNLYRTKMCPALSKTGYCDRGAACSFAHQSSELRGRRKGTAGRHAQCTTACAPPAKVALTHTQTSTSAPCVLTGVSVVFLQVPPPPYTVSEDQGNLDVDVESNLSDADLDLDFATPCKPSSGWSRQSTEEGSEELSGGEFSRQHSEESAWEQESAWGLEEVLEDQSQVEETTRQDEETQVWEALSRCGLVVKNTFLELDDRELPLPALRRVASTGSCTLRGL